MSDYMTPGTGGCPSGYTRDDLRYFLFMTEAGAINDEDAEDVANHLEEGCSWCLREKEFLSWTQPGLTKQGSQRFEELMNGLVLDLEAEADPRNPTKVPETVPAAADPGLPDEDASDTKQRCIKIVEYIESCFPEELNIREYNAIKALVRSEFQKQWDALSFAIKQQADGLCVSASGDELELSEFANDDPGLMLAVVLHVAALMAGAKFPISSRDGELFMNPTAYQDMFSRLFTPRLSNASAGVSRP